MSYTPLSTSNDHGTPPAPPPKPSYNPTPNQGPPLPPPPPQTEPLELEGSGYQHPGYYNQSQENKPYASPPQQHQPQIPPIEQGWLPESVKEKTTTDLHALLNSPELQTALLSNSATTHPSVTVSQKYLEPLIQSNIQSSNNLLSLEQKLSSKRQETQSRLLALKALEQAHRTKLSETESALSQFSPMELYQRLSASVTEQDLLVRGVEESWLEEEGVSGEREVEGWLRRVKEAKTKAILRRERKGRWDEGRVQGLR